MSTLWLKKQKGHNIFLREKPIELLLCLMNRNQKAKYPSMLAKEAKCTYSHTVHLLQKMEINGLVKFEKKGRLKLVGLTKKGEQISDLFEQVGKTLVR
jgi:DNA-binding MarR family transcriptional regulator